MMTIFPRFVLFSRTLAAPEGLRRPPVQNKPIR